MATLSLEPILLELDCGKYMGPILPATLGKLVIERRANQRPPGGGTGGSRGGGGCRRRRSGDVIRSRGGSRGKGGGAGQRGDVTDTGGNGCGAKVWVKYDVQLPDISLKYR